MCVLYVGNKKRRFMFGIDSIENYEIGPMSSWINESWGDEEKLSKIISISKRNILKKCRKIKKRRK